MFHAYDSKAVNMRRPSRDPVNVLSLLRNFEHFSHDMHFCDIIGSK
jgi:hypothetical protein